MIASGYTLDLYCDEDPCAGAPYKGAIGKARFSHEERSVCWNRARRAGWTFDNGRLHAWCPACSKKRSTP